MDKKFCKDCFWFTKQFKDGSGICHSCHNEFYYFDPYKTVESRPDEVDCFEPSNDIENEKIFNGSSFRKIILNYLRLDRIFKSQNKAKAK